MDLKKGGGIMKKEDKPKLISNETIEILLEEYKELLEIKGKYEELKQHHEIKYIYVYDTKPYIENPIKITW